MRIAVYHNLPSGGGKRALYEILRRLQARHNIDVYSLTTADHEYCDIRGLCDNHTVFEFDSLPFAVRPFGRLNQFVRVLDLLRLRTQQRAIARQLDRTAYDVIFVHNCRISQSPSILRYLRTPTAYYCQEPPRKIYEPQPSRTYRSLSRIQSAINRVDPLPSLYRRTLAAMDRSNVEAANAVITNSDYSREGLYRIYGILARVGFLGVDTSKFRPLGLSKQPFVLSVGALTPLKGFDFVIRSLSVVPEQSRPRFIVACNYINPDEAEYLSALADACRVSFEFLAQVTEQTLVRLYNQAVLTLYAPVMEPFGFVPLESMACGTPVVAVREAGVRESVVHGVSGVLVDREPKRFAEAVSSLLQDSRRREKLGRRARICTEKHWQWDSSVRTIERYLVEAASS